ncbi:hypothetical protein [Thiococcus pfennigii]|uniref:hypothetical protein n=1 Tax=Thiococcus pfennigii TaxID=1057 RepID=UPI001904C0A0|nr:hypothetical protein [Thiococcus pfennigii]MBK1732895.1 hypothetical protein [Thiococcus pfennigii]
MPGNHQAAPVVAALFVERNGCYFDVPGVDPWDESRDARRYSGPWPVVAHPPCARWCRLARVNQTRYGQAVGDDGGCFRAAIAAVRRWGGVLEHPAYSLAWDAHALPRPPARGGWVETPCGGWTCHVEQGRYGHPARKRTWLYAHGLQPPELRWGPGPAPAAWISTDRPRAELALRGIRQISKRQAQATPAAFRDVLVAIARLATGGDPCPA